MSEPTPNTVGSQIATVYTFLDKLRERTNDPTMPIQQVMTLLGLYVHGTTALAKLSDITGVKGPSNTRNTQKLGEGVDPNKEPGPGWIVSAEDLTDRRYKYASLTPKGRALLEGIAKEVLR